MRIKIDGTDKEIRKEIDRYSRRKDIQVMTVSYPFLRDYENGKSGLRTCVIIATLKGDDV